MNTSPAGPQQDNRMVIGVVLLIVIVVIIVIAALGSSPGSPPAAPTEQITELTATLPETMTPVEEDEMMPTEVATMDSAEVTEEASAG